MNDYQNVVKIYATSLYQISLEEFRLQESGLKNQSLEKINSEAQEFEQETFEQTLFSQVCFLEEILNQDFSNSNFSNSNFSNSNFSKQDFLFVKILMAQTIEKRQRKDVVDKCLKKYFDIYLINFLKILIDNNRINLIFKIIQEYKKIYYKKNGIEEVLVTSAVTLSEREKIKISKYLEKLFDKKIVARYFVDGKILGGLVIKTENKLFDVSLKNKLENLRNSIKNKLIK